MKNNNELLISNNCIRKFYPNDIGAMAMLKAIISNNGIRAVKKVDVSSRYNTSLPTQRKLAYYPLSKVEKIIIKQDNSLISEEKNNSRLRLLDVIEKIKKSAEEKE